MTLIFCVFLRHYNYNMCGKNCRAFTPQFFFSMGRLSGWEEDSLPSPGYAFPTFKLVKQKVVLGVFRHSESKSGLSFELALLLHGVSAHYSLNLQWFFAGFSQNNKFLGKTRQSDFPEYTPLMSNKSVYILYSLSLNLI